MLEQLGTLPAPSMSAPATPLPTPLDEEPGIDRLFPVASTVILTVWEPHEPAPAIKAKLVSDATDVTIVGPLSCAVPPEKLTDIGDEAVT
jgi:hypothetical protein